MTDGWGTLGKGTAVVLGLGLVGGIVYGLGNHIYDRGHRAGEREESAKSLEGERTIKETFRKNLENLTRDGKLIPRSSCWSLHSDTKRIVESDYRGWEKPVNVKVERFSGCDGVELKVIYGSNGKAKSVSATFKEHKAEMDGKGADTFRKQAEQWVKDDRS